jgi:hypothetical protein
MQLQRLLMTAMPEEDDEQLQEENDVNEFIHRLAFEFSKIQETHTMAYWQSLFYEIIRLKGAQNEDGKLKAKKLSNNAAIVRAIRVIVTGKTKRSPPSAQVWLMVEFAFAETLSCLTPFLLSSARGAYLPIVEIHGRVAKQGGPD